MSWTTNGWSNWWAVYTPTSVSRKSPKPNPPRKSVAFMVIALDYSWWSESGGYLFGIPFLFYWEKICQLAYRLAQTLGFPLFPLFTLFPSNKKHSNSPRQKHRRTKVFLLHFAQQDLGRVLGPIRWVRPRTLNLHCIDFSIHPWGRLAPMVQLDKSSSFYVSDFPRFNFRRSVRILVQKSWRHQRL